MVSGFILGTSSSFSPVDATALDSDILARLEDDIFPLLFPLWVHVLHTPFSPLLRARAINFSGTCFSRVIEAKLCFSFHNVLLLLRRVSRYGVARGMYAQYKKQLALHATYT